MLERIVFAADVITLSTDERALRISCVRCGAILDVRTEVTNTSADVLRGWMARHAETHAILDRWAAKHSVTKVTKPEASR